MNNYFILIILLISLFLYGCAPSEEQLQKEAEKTAQGFSVAWQNEDYSTAYDYFLPNLQAQRSKDDFVMFVKSSQTASKFDIIYDKTVLQTTTKAYAYYTFNGGLLQPKTPAIELDYINGQWRINGFVSYFTSDCIEDIKEGCIARFEIISANEGLEMYKKCLATYSISSCKSLLDDFNDLTQKGIDSITCNKDTAYKCNLSDTWATG